MIIRGIFVSFDYSQCKINCNILFKEGIMNIKNALKKLFIQLWKKEISLGARRESVFKAPMYYKLIDKIEPKKFKK